MLKPLQEKNKALEKKEFILTAIGYTEGELNNPDKIESIYNSTITEEVVNEDGNVIKGVDAFSIVPADEQKQENLKPNYKAKLPLYQYKGDKGEVYVIPLTGNGLWGSIFGYIAVDPNYSKVDGVIFDHEKETPGLGAEITSKWFQQQFKGKKIKDDKGKLYSIKVLKGRGNELDAYSVDGISGATITSTGVMKMLEKDLKRYENYFKKINS